jgi:hypothetical protein
MYFKGTKKNRTHICRFNNLLLIIFINFASYDFSSSISEDKHEHCSLKNRENKKLSSVEDNSYIQLRPIVGIKRDNAKDTDCYYENLDIENDERVKFFFIETSQRDYLRKYFGNEVMYLDA